MEQASGKGRAAPARRYARPGTVTLAQKFAALTTARVGGPGGLSKLSQRDARLTLAKTEGRAVRARLSGTLRHGIFAPASPGSHLLIFHP